MTLKDQEVTARQAAVEFDVTVQHIYMLIYAGRIKARKTDGRWLLDGEDVRVRAQALRAKRARAAARRSRRASEVASGMEAGA